MAIFSKINDVLFESEQSKAVRVRMFFFGFLILFSYISVCVHLERNPMNIFRPLPVLDERKELTIFIPDTDPEKMIEVKRKITVSEDKKIFISNIIKAITRGLYYENTRSSVPTEGMVRSVWFEDEGRVCLVDFRMTILEPDFVPIKGSEENFKKALEKSIKQNISGVEKVVYAENGIYDAQLWERRAD